MDDLQTHRAGNIDIASVCAFVVRLDEPLFGIKCNIEKSDRGKKIPHESNRGRVHTTQQKARMSISQSRCNLDAHDIGQFDMMYMSVHKVDGTLVETNGTRRLVRRDKWHPVAARRDVVVWTSYFKRHRVFLFAVQCSHYWGFRINRHSCLYQTYSVDNNVLRI